MCDVKGVTHIPRIGPVGECMPSIVGVRFARAGRVHYFDAGSMDLAVGERVLVEAEGGPREAEVVIAPRQLLYSELRGPLSPVLQRVDGM